MKKYYLGLLLIMPQMSFAQVVGNHGGGLNLPYLNGSTGATAKQVLCLLKSTQTKQIETDFLKSWNRKYETEADTIDLIDSILLAETTKTLEQLFPKVNSPLYICEQPLEGDTSSLQKRNDAEKELKLLKEIQAAWEQGKEGIEAKNICDIFYTPRLKRLNDLKKVIELYERKP